MDALTQAISTAALAYVIGSFPVAYLVVRRVLDCDVREIGEGNVGARNVFHEVGSFWGVVTFLADFSKGAIVAALYAGAPSWQLAVAGVFVFLGHAFPIWLRFVGGKGLAAVGGFSAMLVPWAALIGGAASGLVWAMTRRFLPTTVTAILVAILTAPLVGYGVSMSVAVVALFGLVGVKRTLDEPRMRQIEARTGWDRLRGGTAS